VKRHASTSKPSQAPQGAQGGALNAEDMLSDHVAAVTGKPSTKPNRPTWDDYGLAARVLHGHAARTYRLLPGGRRGRWYNPQTGLWEDDPAHTRLASLVKLTVEQLPAERERYAADPKKPGSEDLRDAFDDWAKSCRTAKATRDCVTILKATDVLLARETDFDVDPYVLAVRNGTLNLRTGEHRPHSPEAMVTRQAAASFQAGATAPRFHAFLERALPDPELRAHVQRFLGYCLTGDVGAQKLPILWGPGATGKSVLLTVLTGLLGTYAITAQEGVLLSKTHDQHPAGLAEFRGARLVITSETDEGRSFDEQLIKKITSTEDIAARRMYGDPFTFRPTAKILVATNHQLRVSSDGAMWRRLLLWPFENVVPERERIENLPAILLSEEGPGILNWLLEGLAAFQKARGAAGDPLATPASQKDALSAWRAEEDVLGRWIADDCQVDRQSDTLRQTTDALLTSFNTWCRRAGLRETNVIRFGRMMNTAGFASAQMRASSGARVRGYRGIDLH
jgi:putative DNA primase/helicase